MPTYEYICGQCSHEFEAFQLMSAEPLLDCPECKEASLKRKIGLGSGIIFKGGGFYETDFKDKKGSKSSNTENKSNPETKPKPSPKADSKVEAKNSSSSDA